MRRLVDTTRRGRGGRRGVSRQPGGVAPALARDAGSCSARIPGSQHAVMAAR